MIKEKIKNDILKSTALKLIITLLIVLWTYAAFIKIIDYEKARAAMLSQVFPREISEALSLAVPGIELTTALMLCIERTVKAGLYLSLILMSLFTIYIATVLSGAFGRIPCACGGIIQNLSYPEHLVFNMIFLGFSVAGLFLLKDTIKIKSRKPEN